jgi:hypothetical protein
LNQLTGEGIPKTSLGKMNKKLCDYRSKYHAKLVFWDATHAKQTLTMCAQNRREQDVLFAQLVATGKKPDPPPQMTERR